MTVFFTSDSHHSHEAIIGLCDRPFANVEEMDEVMVARWNAVVGPHDEVWHLGDFSLKNPEVVAKFLARLNGRVHLIHGNHDSKKVRAMPQWASSQSYAEIKMEDTRSLHDETVTDKIRKTRIVLGHYPFRSWRGSDSGSINLHGHTHGALSPLLNQCDVGVDVWDFRPVTFAQIMARIVQTAEVQAALLH